MRKFAVCMLVVLTPLIAHALDLIPCPDCEQPVSPRALMCPRCGCPGDAIRKAVTEQESKDQPPPLYPVARFKTDGTTGTAVAYTEAGKTYLILDATSLFGTTSLEILPLTTNAPIAYHAMQAAQNAPLVRFETPVTNLVFLKLARIRRQYSSNGLWINNDGTTIPCEASESPPPFAVAHIDARSNLVAVIGHTLDARAQAVPVGSTWIAVEPMTFREQTALLLGTQRIGGRASLTPQRIQALADTDWVTPFFKQTADRIITIAEQEDKQ